MALLMPLSTPVAFHIFNRPQYSSQVFAAIAQAKPQALLIVADGPRADVPEDQKLCQQARAIVDQVDWECEVLTHFSDSNLGGRCCNAQGLDWVFSQVEEAIILEDDCLPHPSFFPFCQAMLAQYRHLSQVMTISGSNFLGDTLPIPQTYVFSKFFVSWGWASWRRAWQCYDLKMTGWPQYRQAQFFPQPALADWVTQLFDWAYQNQQVWDIPWFYSCLAQNGLTVVPKVNLVSNIGTQGSHTQGNQGLNELPTFNLDLDAMIHPDPMVPNPLFEQLIYELFTANSPKSAQPFLKKLKSNLKKILPMDPR
ncbi:hypothetical protein [Acaryochloris sp. 'Moss Beach']|uniref:hypothetical protein n=2 Tax=Acaryochloris TaxID=155977 RepID=UPI001F41C341|nr:hypothetical protein [Acaryochloris sp. 'Moss Beach']